MNGKQLAVLLAIVGAATVLFSQYENKSTLSEFQTWKSKFGITFESQFE